MIVIQKKRKEQPYNTNISGCEAEKSNNMARRTISDKSPAFRLFIKPNSRNDDSINQSINPSLRWCRYYHTSSAQQALASRGGRKMEIMGEKANLIHP